MENDKIARPVKLGDLLKVGGLSELQELYRAYEKTRIEARIAQERWTVAVAEAVVRGDLPPTVLSVSGSIRRFV